MKIHYFLLQFYKIKSAGVLWTVTNAQTCGSFKRHQSKKKKRHWSNANIILMSSIVLSS